MREKPMPVWTVSMIALTVYLYVVHSFKLPIGTYCIIVGVLAVLMKERPLMVSEPMKWYCGYLAWSLLLVPLSIDVPRSFEAWTDSLKLMIIMFIALNTIKNEKQHRYFTLAYLAFFALYPARGTLFNFLTGQGMFGRYGWNFTFSNFNDLAALTIIPLALAVDRLRTPESKWIKLCALAGLLFLPFLILITQSRGGMLGAAAFFIFLIGRSRYRLRLIVAMAVFAAGAAAFAPKAVWERILGMQHLTSVETLREADTSAEQRYIVWQVAGQIIKENPLGVGIGAYPIAHAKYARFKREWKLARGSRDSHSTYLGIFAEGGIISFGLFMMIFVSCYRGLMRLAKSVKGSTDPADRLLADRVQVYQACFAGLAICGVFGSLEGVVFPFLLVSLCTVTGMIFGKPEAVAVKQLRKRPTAMVQRRAMAR